MKSPLFLAGLAALLVVGCSRGGSAPASNDPYAGLDREIVSWRNNLEARHPACAKKVEGKGCVGFEITCKAQQTITAAEAEGGTRARVVAAMTFTGGGGSGSPGSAFAVFTRTGETWTRVEAKPVNLGTCAPA